MQFVDIGLTKQAELVAQLVQKELQNRTVFHGKVSEGAFCSAAYLVAAKFDTGKSHVTPMKHRAKTIKWLLLQPYA